MGKIENNLTRKKKNEHFIKAFEYVASMLKMNQTQLATAIGSKVAYISVYRNCTRPVPDETIDALIRISRRIDSGNGQIYKPYIEGYSDYMLLRNVPDDESYNVEQRKINPDYDILKTRHEEKNKITEDFQTSFINRDIDSSSAINAALSAQVETIANLKQTIADMKEQHLRELAAKDAHIADLTKLAEERLHRIAELRRIIDSNNFSLKDYPFQIGVSEKTKPQNHPF